MSARPRERWEGTRTRSHFEVSIHITFLITFGHIRSFSPSLSDLYPVLYSSYHSHFHLELSHHGSALVDHRQVHLRQEVLDTAVGVLSLLVVNTIAIAQKKHLGKLQRRQAEAVALLRCILCEKSTVKSITV